MTLKDLKELVKRATPGPWVRNQGDYVGFLGRGFFQVTNNDQIISGGRTELENADFIVAARNHIEELIERVKLLSIALEEYTIGDHNGVLDDAGELGREVLNQVGFDVPLRVKNEDQ